MFIDSNLQFDPAATAITSSAASTNIFDLGTNRDLGVGRFQGKILVAVGTAFTSSTATATLNVQLQGQQDSGSGAVSGNWQTLVESGTVPLGQLQANSQIVFDLPPIMQIPGTPVTTTGSASNSSTSLTVTSGTYIVNGMEVVGAGIAPGTFVSTGGGTTSITLSGNTTAAITTATTLTFIPTKGAPRYLRLYYTASNTMTAGTVQSYLVLDVPALGFYKPGITVPV